MAHHLADLIAKAEEASGPEKADHERAATDLILKLWLHRRGLPQQADPLAGYSEALKVLKQLRPESNPWLRFHRQAPYVGELRKMFDSMSCAVVGGIALTQLSSPQMADESQVKFIDPSEAALLDAFNQWQPTAVETPSVEVVFVEAESSPSDDAARASAEDDGTNSTEIRQSGIKPEAVVKGEIAEHLREVHAQLGRLLEAWNAASPASAENLDE